MLEDFKNSQKKFYGAIVNSVNNGKISHAYLIETSTFANGKELALSLAKFLLCNNQNSDSNVSELIDNNSYSNLLVIEPDGLWIKKEQLQEIKNKFSERPVDNNYQIYIINHADRLNKSAANSMLKFIEEPEDGIIAILVADNRYNVLNTIVSRCQVYTLENGQDDDIKNVDQLLDFIMNLEREGTRTICYTQDLWHSKYKSKDEAIEAFSNLEKLYLEIINYKIKKISKCDNLIKDFDYIIGKNTEMQLVNKLSVITKIKSLVEVNANMNLLIDKFIIEYCEVK